MHTKYAWAIYSPCLRLTETGLDSLTFVQGTEEAKADITAEGNCYYFNSLICTCDPVETAFKGTFLGENERQIEISSYKICFSNLS